MQPKYLYARRSGHGEAARVRREGTHVRIGAVRSPAWVGGGRGTARGSGHGDGSRLPTLRRAFGSCARSESGGDCAAVSLAAGNRVEWERGLCPGRLERKVDEPNARLLTLSFTATVQSYRWRARSSTLLPSLGLDGRSIEHRSHAPQELTTYHSLFNKLCPCGLPLSLKVSGRMFR